MPPKRSCKTLCSPLVDTLFKWQNQRFLWVLMAVIVGGLVLAGHLFFQSYLHMTPCEYCVYIRFAMLVIVAGGLLVAINPKNMVLKLMGCAAAFYGAIIGILYSLNLNRIHYVIHNPETLFGLQGCSMEPNFPLGLPLMQWLPEWFQPTGDCGYDAPIVPEGATLSGVQQWFIDMYTASDGWYLIPSLKFMNMSQASFLVFSLVAVVLVVVIAVWWIKAARIKA